MVAQRNIGSVWTVEQYLDMERQSLIKHEFIDGRVYAMSGGNQDHSRIGINVTVALADRLEGTQYQVFNSDMKVLLANEKDFLYPDAMITCDQRDLIDRQRDYIRYPCLIVEVLSPSTTKFDLSAKFDLYRERATLQEYMLVSTDCQRVEVRSKSADTDVWKTMIFGPGENIVIPSINLHIPIALLYRGLRYLE